MLEAQGSRKTRRVVRSAGVACLLAAAAASSEGAALTLRATVNGVRTASGLTITLERWSTDAERAPIVAALAAPSPSPAPAAGAAAGRAGRGGRAGGRGAPPPPPSPAARLSAAIKSAPTLGYVWGDGVTGYSIKYAWHAADRIVLITDRRLGAHAPEWTLPPGPAPDAEYTLIEMHLDAKGVGEGKTSLSANVAVDAAANTLALDGYGAAPAQLRITR